MSFFTSEYDCKLDAKGRIVLPSRIKSNLPESGGNEMMLQKGFEPCLVLYTMIEFKKIYSKIQGLNQFNSEHRKLQRNFFNSISQIELDNNGRFLIPRKMLQHASLEKDVLIIGMGNRIEVWNPEVYQKYSIQEMDEFSDLAQKYLDI